MVLGEPLGVTLAVRLCDGELVDEAVVDELWVCDRDALAACERVALRVDDSEGLGA